MRALTQACRWLPLLVLAACDCSPRREPVEPPEPGSKGIAWEEIGRRVGEQVPTPGPPPELRPLEQRRSERLGATPHLLWEAEYASVVLGEPGLALLPDAAPKSSATVVALEQDGPRELASVSSRFPEIAADGEHVYCASEDGLQRIGIRAGAVTTIAADAVKAVALGDTHVYWVTGGAPRPGEPPSVVQRARKDEDGAEAETLYRDLPYIHELVLRGDRIYWVAKMRPRRKRATPFAASRKRAVPC